MHFIKLIYFSFVFFIFIVGKILINTNKNTHEFTKHDKIPNARSLYLV